MEGATVGAREVTTYTAIDTQSTSGSLLPMYRAASCGQQRSTNGSKYGMVERGVVLLTGNASLILESDDELEEKARRTAATLNED